jgi:hypothetical protein
MLSQRLKSRAWFAASLLTLLLVPGPAFADIYYETIYLPTSMMDLPTSYVVPTSYTSSFIPTSTILSTDSVLLPTSTTYYRPSILRPRRYVARTTYSYAATSTILPTTYVMPTSSTIVPTTYVRSSIVSPTSYIIDDGIVTTSYVSSPCETSTSVTPTRSSSKPQSTANGPTVISSPTGAGAVEERRPSAALNGTPSNEEGTSSNVNPPVSVPSTPSPPKPMEAAPKPGDQGAPMEQPPALGSGNGAPKPIQSGATGTDGVVVPPAGQLGNPATTPNETSFRRESKKPVYTRNILRGKVISAESKSPEEGVTVIISNMTKQFADRQAMTDADGEFKVSLPDGDWAVKVKMPSGTIFTVRSDYVTASNGKITDSSGRIIADCVITR